MDEVRRSGVTRRDAIPGTRPAGWGSNAARGSREYHRGYMARGRALSRAHNSERASTSRKVGWAARRKATRNLSPARSAHRATTHRSSRRREERGAYRVRERSERRLPATATACVVCPYRVGVPSSSPPPLPPPAHPLSSPLPSSSFATFATVVRSDLTATRRR